MPTTVDPNIPSSFPPGEGFGGPDVAGSLPAPDAGAAFLPKPTGAGTSPGVEGGAAGLTGQVEELEQAIDTLGGTRSTLHATLGDAQATADLIYPTLDNPDQKLITQFLEHTQSMSSAPGIPVGNAWLSTNATLVLFMIISEITRRLSYIELAEAQLKIVMANIKREMAKDSADLTKLSGEIEAAKHRAQATQAMIEASLALAQIAMTVTIESIRIVKIGNEMKKWDNDYVKSQQKLDTDRNIPQRSEAQIMASGEYKAARLHQVSTVEQQVSTQIQSLTQISSSTMTMGKSFAEAVTQTTLAALEEKKASAEAQRELISKLADLLWETASKTLGEDIQGNIQKIIDQLLQSTLAGVQKASADIWSARG